MDGLGKIMGGKEIVKRYAHPGQGDSLSRANPVCRMRGQGLQRARACAWVVSYLPEIPPPGALQAIQDMLQMQMNHGELPGPCGHPGMFGGSFKRVGCVRGK